MAVDTYIYSKESGLTTCQGVSTLPARAPGKRVWVDIESEGSEELSAVAKHYGLHELTIEDCLTPNHLPKLEDYGDYLFMIFRGIKPLYGFDVETEQDIEEDEDKFTRKVAIFLADDFIITFRRKPVTWLDAVLRQVKQYPEITLGRSTAALAHRVVDVLITRFQRAVGYLEDILKEHEEEVLENPKDFALTRLLSLKHELVTLIHTVRDQRSIIARLASEPELIRDKMQRRYFKDADDNAVVVTHTLDEIVRGIDSIKDTYFAMASVQLGDTMRILAVFTTIALPLHLIVGFYGMNFSDLPLLHSPHGVLFAFALMLFSALAMVIFFRKKHWL